MIFPNFLKEFEQKIRGYELGFVKIAAKPIQDGKTLSITASKFLGKSYLPVGFEYPKSKQGEPMIMLSQINFSEVPALLNYPSSGILQLFVSGSDWYDMDDYRIIFHEEIGAEQTSFDFLTDDLYSESPIYCEHELSFSSNTSFGGDGDFRFNFNFNGLDFWDFHEKLNKQQQDELEKFFDASGHKIGGYAYFTQSDPRDYDEKLKNDVLLLQIDTDDQIMFGDCGVAHLFINQDDLLNKRFEKAYFNWDCC